MSQQYLIKLPCSSIVESLSNVMFQGIMASEEKLGKTMLFPLAEKMVEKFINEGKIEAEAGAVFFSYLLLSPR